MFRNFFRFFRTSSKNDENCEPIDSSINCFYKLRGYSDHIGTGVKIPIRAQPHGLMTHREQSRSNSDWTDDLPHAENTSIVNHCPLEYGHFSWKIDNLQITGFFTYRDRKDKSAINMKLAQLCMGFNQNSNAEAVRPKILNPGFLQSKNSGNSFSGRNGRIFKKNVSNSSVGESDKYEFSDANGNYFTNKQFRLYDNTWLPMYHGNH